MPQARRQHGAASNRRVAAYLEVGAHARSSMCCSCGARVLVEPAHAWSATSVLDYTPATAEAVALYTQVVSGETCSVSYRWRNAAIASPSGAPGMASNAANSSK